MTFADLSPLANHLWQSTLFVAVAWMLTLALVKNRAAVRYWLWLAASAKFLIPFAWMARLGASFTWRVTPVAGTVRIPVLAEQIGQPFQVLSDLPRIDQLTPASQSLGELDGECFDRRPYPGAILAVSNCEDIIS